MSHASAKELLKEAVEQLPVDATVEDAHEEVGRRLGL
jgi:hypothetical protein